jgi:hypothetical protein
MNTTYCLENIVHFDSIHITAHCRERGEGRNLNYASSYAELGQLYHYKKAQ